MFFRQILFFLTYFDKLLKLTNELKKDPKWLSCYNFMSLLNIPETLENFGPLKNFWEGSYIGEKFITQTKSEFFGKRNNWTYAMLQRIQKKSIFEQMIDEKIEKKTIHFARYKNLITHKITRAVNNRNSTKRCLSVILRSLFIIA